MYLTTIEHGSRSWNVELRVIHDGRVPGSLEFSFVPSHGEPEVRYTWEVPSELVDALHLEGKLSEEVLRQQLSRAITESRMAEALGSARFGSSGWSAAATRLSGNG
jgi:hypothetical protein